jgi:hypothetical protein
MIGEMLDGNHAVTHETVVASIPLAEKPVDVVKISWSRRAKKCRCSTDELLHKLAK